MPLVEIVLLTHKNFYDDHVRDLLGSHLDYIRVVTVDTPLGDRQSTISLQEIDLYLELAQKSIAASLSANRRCQIVFMALDDYLAPFAQRSWKVRRLAKDAAVYAIKYRVGYLLGRPNYLQLRSWALRLLTIYCVTLSCAKLIAFDERLARIPHIFRPVSVLPDPWSFRSDATEAAVTSSSVSRSSLGLRSQDFVALVVGRQDIRKGFDRVVSAAPGMRSAIPNFHLLVAGQVPYPSVSWRELRRKEWITHIADFVPEDQLPSLFYAADCVLLPYSSNFDSTSGVLAHSAAFGRPVCATGHGLVGHRVRRWRMGLTFTSGAQDDGSGLADCVIELRHSLEMDPDCFGVGLRAFAKTCNRQQFDIAISQALELAM
jgi:glycosyltransferase involved in cell wall biosynthesis